MGYKETIYEGILEGDMNGVVEATNGAIADSVPASELLYEAHDSRHVRGGAVCSRSTSTMCPRCSSRRAP